LPLLGVVLLLFAVYHVVRAQQTPSKSEPLVEPARSPFRAPIAGTGIIEPDTEVISVGSHLSGVVAEVLVTVGDLVYKGQTPLFRLDDRALRSDLASREASLKAAETQLDRLKSMPRPEEVPPAEARWKEAQENLADQVDQYERMAKVSSASIAEGELVR